MGIESSAVAPPQRQKKAHSPLKLAPNPHRKVYLSRAAFPSTQSPSNLGRQQKVQAHNLSLAPEQLTHLCKSWPNLIGFDSIYRDCLGVLKFRDDYCNGDVFANAILISDTLLLTAARQIQSVFSDKTMYRIRYWNFTTRRQYFIQQVRLLSLFDDSSLPLRDRFHYCLIRIDRPVVCPKYPSLGINFTKDYKALFFSSFESPPSNGPSTMSVKLGLTCEYNQEEDTIILPSKEEFQSNISGGQVSISVQDQMVLLGLQTSMNRAQNQTLTFNPYFIQEIKNMVVGDRQKTISFYFFDQWKKKSLFEYVQEMKVLRQKQKQNYYAGKDDSLWNKIDEELRKYLALSQEEQLQWDKRMFEERMSGKLDFSVRGRQVESIDVGKHRFYYDFYDRDFTLNDLAIDYEKATGSALTLQIEGISLDRNAFLQELMQKGQKQVFFTHLLNAMNDFYKLEYIPVGYIEEMAQSPFNLNRDTRKLKPFKIMIRIIKGHRFIEAFPYFIYSNTTVNKIKEDLLKNKPYNLENITVRLSAFQTIREYDSPIPLYTQSIDIHLIDSVSYIGLETDILIAASRQGQVKYEQVKLKSLLESKEKVKILSYNEKKKKLSCQQVAKIVQTVDFFQYCQFDYKIEKGKGKLFTFMCSIHTKIMVSQFTWKKACEIFPGQKFLGLNEDMTGFIEYKIDKIRSRTSKNGLAMCTLSINNTHTLIANRIIVHNQDEFEVMVLFYKNQTDSDFDLQRLNVLPSQKLKKYFENYSVYLGENKLNKELTFGDLAIQSFQTLFKIPEEAMNKKRELTNKCYIRRYEDRKYEFSSKEQETWILNNSYEVSDGQVLPYDKTALRISPVVLLHPKFYLERERYYHNCHLHSSYESTCLVKHQNQSHQNDQNYVPIQSMEQNFAKRRALYYYTKLKIHIQINEYLCKIDVQKAKSQRQKNHFAISHLIIKRLKEQPILEAVVYRGINLLGDIQIKLNGLLLFKSFTSASQSMQTAKRFATIGFGRSIILEIKTFSGKSISRFSSCYWESQVLIPPFTYFHIESQRKMGKFTVLKLTQLQTPQNHKNSTVSMLFQRSLEIKIKESLFSNQNGFDLVRYKELSKFELFLEEFLWLYLVQNRNIALIYDNDVQDEIEQFFRKYHDTGLSLEICKPSKKANQCQLFIFWKYGHPIKAFFKDLIVYSRLIRDFY